MNTERKPMQEKSRARRAASSRASASRPSTRAHGRAGVARRIRSPLVDSINPATGEVIARIRAAGAADYERIMATAAAAFAAWRNGPAPRRGEAVRLMGEALRARKDLLGSLVSLEWARSRPRRRRSPGNDRHRDFAVGQSRCFTLSMHSERPSHRMYEQWHPLG